MKEHVKQLVEDLIHSYHITIHELGDLKRNLVVSSKYMDSGRIEHTGKYFIGIKALRKRQSYCIHLQTLICGVPTQYSTCPNRTFNAI